MTRRVFYVSPGTDMGGGEVSLLTLISNLDPKQYQPIVCTYGEGKFAQAARNAIGRVHVLGYSGPLSQPAFICRLANLMRRERADLVHVNTLDIRAGLAARTLGRPLVGHLRVIFPTTAIDTAFVLLADSIITVSGAVRSWFCGEQRLSPSRFTVVHNAVDTTADAPAQGSLRADLGIPDDAPVVGVVGRIDPWKGQDIFVDAAALVALKIPSARFVIVGKPGTQPEEVAYLRQLEAMAGRASLRGRLYFLGYRTDALELIRDLDLLVVPSLVLQTPEGIKTEGFGRVAAEGLAMGTPVIASRAGGLPEIIEDGQTGRLVPPGDAASLAETIVQLMKDSAQRHRLSERGRQSFAQNFTVARHVHRVQSLYDRLPSG